MNPMGPGNFARCVETITTTQLSVTQPAPDVATIYSIDISQFNRAQAIAANYQFYRPKYVKFVYEPLLALGSYPTNVGTAPLPQKMNFYYIMNRQGNNPGAGQATLQWMLDQGAKPIPFGDSRARNVTIKYKPNLLDAYSENSISVQGGSTTIPAAGIPMFNKWINSWEQATAGGNIQNVTQDWNGHFVIVEPSNTTNFNMAGNTPVANVKVTVEWEFKQPYANVTPPLDQVLNELKHG